MDYKVKVALVLPVGQEFANSIQKVLSTLGYKDVHIFHNSDEAYEVASREQFGLFVVGISDDDYSGIVLLQRLREIGNYGFEPFLFISKKISPSHLALFLEYDVDYALTHPLTVDRIRAKLQFLVERENNISPDIDQYRSAKSALYSGLTSMAEELALSLINKDKVVEKSKILLADIAVVKGDTETAEKIYLEVIENNSFSIAAKHKLAKVYMQQSRYEEAKDILDALVLEQPFHIKVLENAGISNFKLGYYELAMEQMEKLKKLHKENKVAGTVMVNISIKKGDYQELAKKLRLTHNEDEMVSVLNKAGIDLSLEQNYEGAIAIYKDCLNVVTRDDYRSKVIFNLGLTYQKMGKIDDACDCFQQALHFNPNLAKAEAILQKLKKSA